MSTPSTRASAGVGPGRLGDVRRVPVGQHLIAVVLSVVGVARAVGVGVVPAAAVAAGCAILGCYAAGAALSGRGLSPRGAYWWLAAITAAWLVAVWVSTEFVWVAFLLWLIGGHLLSLGGAIAYAVGVYAVTALAPLLSRGTTGWADLAGPFIGGVFAVGISRGYLTLQREAAERERLVESLRRAHQETSELADELAWTQRHVGAVAERARLARDIHDTVAQSLSSIRLLAHAAAQDETGTGRSAARQIEDLAGEGLGDVRRIVAALAPAELEADALPTALAQMLERLREQTGLATELHVDDTLPRLAPPVEVAFLRAAQSSLANVRLHAHATRVVVSLIDDEDRVRLDIIDDGRGFDAAAWERAPYAGDSGYGLRFLRSRLRALGGELDVESAPGEGTALSASVPVTPTSGGPA